MTACQTLYSVYRHVWISHLLGVAWEVFLTYSILPDPLNIGVLYGSVLRSYRLSNYTLSICRKHYCIREGKYINMGW